MKKLSALNSQSGADGELTRDSTVAELAEAWLEEKHLEGIATNTLRAYRRVITHHVLPAMVNARSAPAVRAVLDHVIKARVEQGRDVAKLRNALHQMFALAVRHDVLAANPVAEVSKFRRPRRQIAFLTPDH